MTILTIESDSEETTALFLKIAEERGVHVTKDEHRVLTDDDVLFGFGRKATDAEMTQYLLSTEEDNEDEYINIETIRQKYPNP